MSFDVFTHTLHGQAALPPSGDGASAGAVPRQTLVAAAGRIVAVAQGDSVHLYDSHDTADLGAVLGSGACKLRFLCAFPVRDIADPVTVAAITFLRGGHLALAGTAARGTGALDVASIH